MKEQLIATFKLPLIHTCAAAIVIMGFKKTGMKFSVIYNGSKGYLSNVAITCECSPSKDNIIWIEKLRNKNGTLRKVKVNIFHSHQNGVRVSIGKDEPRIIEEHLK